MPIPRPVLANLESGRRDSVSAAELLVLAAALGVAPVELLCPVGYDERLELLPGRTMDPLRASRWVDGELALDVTGPETVLRPPAAGEESGTWLAEHHAALVEQVQVREAELYRSIEEFESRKTVMDGYREVAEQSIRFIRAEMRRRGMTLPPLPAALKGAADGPGEGAP